MKHGGYNHVYFSMVFKKPQKGLYSKESILTLYFSLYPNYSLFKILTRESSLGSSSSRESFNGIYLQKSGVWGYGDGIFEFKLGHGW